MSWVITAYMLVIVVYALLSWLPGALDSKLGYLLGKLVEPYQHLFDFATFGRFDFAPLIAIVILEVAQFALKIIATYLIEDV